MRFGIAVRCGSPFGPTRVALRGDVVGRFGIAVRCGSPFGPTRVARGDVVGRLGMAVRCGSTGRVTLRWGGRDTGRAIARGAGAGLATARGGGGAGLATARGAGAGRAAGAGARGAGRAAGAAGFFGGCCACAAEINTKDAIAIATNAVAATADMATLSWPLSRLQLFSV